MSIVARLRALGWVTLALLYFWFAGRLAATAASGFIANRGNGFVLLDWIFLLLLLLIGFGAMGYLGQRQQHPIVKMGLERRPGWTRELLLGVAIGWSGMVACVLPMACAGAIYLTWIGGWHSIGSLLIDFLILAVASLAEEVAFRGYPFQRLIEAVGPGTATLLAALSFAAVHMNNPNSSGSSTVVTLLAGILLAVAYLRTRALWVGWGFHMGWNMVMAICFGLPVSGLTSFSPFFSTHTYGPFWLTGGNYGPEGSAIAILVLLVLIFVMISATRQLKYQYAMPPLVAGGMAVDIDELARRQHEAAMSTAQPKAPALIQIGTMPGAISRPMAQTPTQTQTQTQTQTLATIQTQASGVTSAPAPVPTQTLSPTLATVQSSGLPGGTGFAASSFTMPPAPQAAPATSVGAQAAPDEVSAAQDETSATEETKHPGWGERWGEMQAQGQAVAEQANEDEAAGPSTKESKESEESQKSQKPWEP